MMKTKTVFLSSLVAFFLFSCENGADGTDESKKNKDHKVSEKTTEKDSTDEKNSDKEERKLTVVMDAKSDSEAEGHIKLKESEGKVIMNVEMQGLTPGEHAIHIHEKGDCSAADGTSAGGHWNPSGKKHGKWGEHAFHMGDIGNLVADKQGNVSYTFATEKWCLGCENTTKNILGKSFIIHAGADDFESQPSGNAGSRVACGLIEM